MEPLGQEQTKLNLLPIAVIILVGLAVVFVLIMAKPTPKPKPAPGEPSPLKVSVMPAYFENASLSVNTQGTLEPRHAIALQAQVGGQIVAVSPSYDNGGFFEKGDTLIIIDDSDYKVALVEAQSRLADASRQLAEEKGRARQARREWRDLGNQEANHLFMRKPQLAAAKAQLELAKARVSRAQLDLDRTKIKAPFAGRLQKKYADQGQIIAPNTLLADIYSQHTMQVRLPLTEQQVALIDLPLQKNTTRSTQVQLTANVAGDELIWQGKLARADAFVDKDSRYFYAWVDIETDLSTPALPGLFVQAQIQGKSIPKVAKLPRSALVNRNKIVAVDGEHSTIWHTVSVLYKNAEHIWIQGPFSNGDKILLEKQILAPTGTEVSPKEINLSEVQP